jgi:diketogulonate reductase-like aldo/keto reductase
MDHKQLGETGIWLPEIGLGTQYYSGGVEPLREGIALGACLIDTAESYGTEEIVGEAIKGRRSQVFLATKVCPRHFRRLDLRNAVDGSLHRLRTEYIDLYQLHGPNYTVPLEETMAAMEDLVDLGKIRFVGVSRFSTAELQKAQAAMHKYKIVSNQVRYSLVDRTIESSLLDYCQQNHVTVIAFSPLGQGVPHLIEKDPDGMLGNVSAMTGKTHAQVALNWCTAKDCVLAIPKANSREHVGENCSASGWRLSSHQTKLLDNAIAYRRRGRGELMMRRLARHALQRFGHHV